MFKHFGNMEEDNKLKKLVKKIGNSGHVTLPKKWVGKFVLVNLEENDRVHT